MEVKKYEIYLEEQPFEYDEQIRGSVDIVNFCKEKLKMHKLDREDMYCIALDTKGNVIGINLLGIGSLDGILISVPSIFRFAILSNAHSVVLVHNHPSGDTSPSAHDIETTMKVQKTGELLGIPLLDHIIIGRNGHCSLKAEDLM